ncbi:heparinase II/III family protein [Paenibacillus sp. J5C_2022]|nr:heparinase II/III family protein [Paenibacillus sp. J5C2022]
MLATITVLFCFNSFQASAFSDTSNMSDEDFFGVWNAAESAWTTEGKIDYAYNASLSSVENYVKQGDYNNAGTALLNYFVNRTSVAVQPFSSEKRNSDTANLILDDVFTSDGEFYLDTFMVNNQYQTIDLSVTNAVEEAMDENKQITFILMGREKTGSAATFYSREQSGNKPQLEVTAGGSTITLTAVKDTYIQPETYGDTNYGTSQQLIVKDSGAPFDSLTRRTYIQFDLSSLTDPPSGATLKIYGRNASQTGNMDIMVYRIADTAWNETAMTWNTTYGNTFSWQGVSESTDWAQPLTGAAASWKNIMSRFHFASVLVNEYQATSDESYASKLISLMLDFIVDQGNSDPGYYSRIDPGIRSVFWIRAYDALLDSASIDAAANTGIVKYIWQMANHLYDPDNYDTFSNFGVLQARGLYFPAVYFPEFKDSANWLSTANARFDGLIKTLNYIDGSYTEDNSQYNIVTINTIMDSKNMGDLNNQTFGETFNLGLERMGRYTMNLLLPNGYNPQYGDADYVNNRPVVLDIGNTYNNEELIYYGSNGASGTEPDSASLFYPESKVAVMRTGWTDDALYMHVNNNHGVHAHSDLLSVIAYAYGQPLLIDPGRFTYSTASPIVQWLRLSPEAHNTIEINDSNGNASLKKQVDAWASNGNYDFFEGNHEAYPGFNHQRSVLFINSKYWIVSDYITSNAGTNKYEQTWHLLPDANVTLDGTTKRAKSQFGGSANIQIVPADPSSLSASLRDGYYSERYQNVSDAPFVSYVKNASGNVTYDTVLYPTESADINRNVQVIRLSTGAPATTATGLKIELNSGNNGDIGYYYLSHEKKPSAARSFDSYQFDGKMAYVETTHTGSINNASINAGKTLKQNGTPLIDSSLEISDMGVVWNGSALEISGTNLKPDSDRNTAVALYAPSVTSVKLNGTAVPFSVDGDYIYAVRPSKVTFNSKTDYSSVQGANGWSYLSYDGTNYSELEYEASLARWEQPGGVHPYVSDNLQTTGSSRDSVRRWTAPEDGVIHMKSSVKGHPNYTSGDGRNVRISRNGTTNVWPKSGWQFIAGNDMTGYEIDETLAVNAGDTIEMTVNSFNTATADHLIWETEIILHPGASLFYDGFEDGDSNGWMPLNASRWTVGTDEGDYSYSINTSNYSNQSGNRLGEYALIDGSNYNNFTINLKVRMGDDVTANAEADFAVVFHYQDADNYYYLLMSNDMNGTQLFKVRSGERQLIADSDGLTDWITDNAYHSISIDRDDSGNIVVYFDNQAVMRAIDKEFAGGQIGIGSYNDSAYFDDIAVINVK